MTSRRKIPFSNKQKKEQLQAKKAKDRIGTMVSKGMCMSELPTSSKKTADRYALKFRKESNEEVEKRKEIAREQLQPIYESNLEMSEEELFPEGMKIPIRPPWDYSMGAQELEKRENRYFLEYVNDLEKKFGNDSLSHYEENLETWRQLWRVMEMSDILLVIVDIRFPNLLFPPMIYDYIIKEKKEILLILNKIDLAPPSVVLAWMHHFKERYPQLHIILFTSFPGYNLYGQSENKAGLQRRRRKGKLRMSAEGAQQLYEACQKIVGEHVDLTTWKNKIAEEANKEFDDIEIEETISKTVDATYYDHERYKNGILTIGCVGQPNVGKSSIINALMGNKVVSVSKTPGHTKHFQTIFLTSNVRLCDCPGLVFPSKVPKTAQVLMGSFPIAQLREPYTSIKFLAERVNLIKLLNIKHPSDEVEWSAMDICEAWAIRNGFFTARTARPDLYRAANAILRMVLDGTIPFSFVPPSYCKKKEIWETSPELDRIQSILAPKSDAEETHRGQSAYRSESEESSDRSKAEDDSDETVVQNKFAALLGDSD